MTQRRISETVPITCIMECGSGKNGGARNGQLDPEHSTR